MDLNMNPRVPTQEHLEYYYQNVLLPEYSEDELEAIDVGQGRTAEVPKLSFKKKKLKPLERFERGGREYRPRDMFFEQNEGKAFRPYESKFKKRNVEARVEAARKIPKFKFSLKPVKLIKPRYGKLPKSLR